MRSFYTHTSTQTHARARARTALAHVTSNVFLSVTLVHTKYHFQVLRLLLKVIVTCFQF
jgi:hypothetical protein